MNTDPETDANCESAYYPMQNANFNVMGVTDAAGVLVERYEYTPYGQRRVYTKAGANDPLTTAPLYDSQPASENHPHSICDLGHQGLAHEKEFGLIYNRHRYGDPDGRWGQRDPAEYAAGMNLHEYVRSRPKRSLDPMGLLDSYCKNRCTGLTPITKKLNDQIMARIRKAYAGMATGSLGWKLGVPVVVPRKPVQIMESIRDALATDVKPAPLVLAEVHPTSVSITGRALRALQRSRRTSIEAWIHNLSDDYRRVGKKTYKIVPTADAILIVCPKHKPAFYCIGSDKIGHFFQQGYMLHELFRRKARGRAKRGTAFAKAFSLHLEELPGPTVSAGHYQPDEKEYSGYGSEVIDWISRNPEEKFHGYDPKKLTGWKGYWGGSLGAAGDLRAHIGGVPIAQKSPADHAANMAGMEFYNELAKLVDRNQLPGGFDICNYISTEWAAGDSGEEGSVHTALPR